MTGPGPQWAIGGDTVAVRLGSEASGRRRVTGGKVRVMFICTGLEAILLKPCTDQKMWAVETLKTTSVNLGVSCRIFDPAYC